MIKKTLKYSAIALSGLFIFSCSSSNNDLEEILDTEKPGITINKPTKDQHLHHGDALDIDVLLKDNLELASYKIDIHYGGDGHHHFGPAAANESSSTYKKWETKEEHKLESGQKEYHVKRSDIKVPNDAQPGKYHFGVIVLDKAGLQTASYIDIEVADHGHDDHDDHDH